MQGAEPDAVTLLTLLAGGEQPGNQSDVVRSTKQQFNMRTCDTVSQGRTCVEGRFRAPPHPLPFTYLYFTFPPFSNFHLFLCSREGGGVRKKIIFK